MILPGLRCSSRYSLSAVLHIPGCAEKPSRIAIAGNSVGGDMTAALNLMVKDRKGPKIGYQVLLWPATNAGVDTCSYEQFANGRFLPRAFMKYGWDLYAPTEKERDERYVSPLRASLEQLRGLPPTIVITDENDVLRDEGEAFAHRLQDASDGGQMNALKAVGEAAGSRARGG